MVACVPLSRGFTCITAHRSLLSIRSGRPRSHSLLDVCLNAVPLSGCSWPRLLHSLTPSLRSLGSTRQPRTTAVRTAAATAAGTVRTATRTVRTTTVWPIRATATAGTVWATRTARTTGAVWPAAAARAIRTTGTTRLWTTRAARLRAARLRAARLRAARTAGLRATRTTRATWLCSASRCSPGSGAGAGVGQTGNPQFLLQTLQQCVQDVSATLPALHCVWWDCFVQSFGSGVSTTMPCPPIILLLPCSLAPLLHVCTVKKDIHLVHFLPYLHSLPSAFSCLVTIVPSVTPSLAPSFPSPWRPFCRTVYHVFGRRFDPSRFVRLSRIFSPASTAPLPPCPTRRDSSPAHISPSRDSNSSQTHVSLSRSRFADARPQQKIQAFYPPGSLDIIAAKVASAGTLAKVATEWKMPMELAGDLVSRLLLWKSCAVCHLVLSSSLPLSLSLAVTSSLPYYPLCHLIFFDPLIIAITEYQQSILSYLPYCIIPHLLTSHSATVRRSVCLAQGITHLLHSMPRHLRRPMPPRADAC